MLIPALLSLYGLSFQIIWRSGVRKLKVAHVTNQCMEKMKKICLFCILLMASCTTPSNAHEDKKTAEEVSPKIVSVDTLHVLLEGVIEAIDPNEEGVLSIEGEQGKFTMLMEKNGKVDDVTIYKLKVISYREMNFKKENGYNNWTGELVLNAIDPNTNSVVGQLKGEFYSGNDSEDTNHHAMRMGCGQKGCHSCTYIYNGVYTDSRGTTSSFHFHHDNYLLFENHEDYDEEP